MDRGFYQMVNERLQDKGCKTSLQDEVEGNLDATWGGTYDTENYIIGVILE